MSNDVPDPDDDVPESEQHPASDDVPESEQESETAPADWHKLAVIPTEQLEREMRGLHVVWDRHSYLAWLSVMAIIPRVRALKEHYGGDVFAAKCRMLCRIGKTAANNIVRWGIAEPRILNEIWETVHAEAHAASVRGVRYDYPTINKMCLWYKPEEDDDVTDEVSEEGEEGLRDVLTGARSEEETSNDPPANDRRNKAEIAKQNIMLEDHNKTLTRKQTLLEQRLADRDTDIDHLSGLASEQRDSLAQLRQLVAELEAGLATRDAEIIARDAQISARDAEIAASNTEIIARDAQIAAKDAEIAATNAELAAKDTEIAYLRAAARQTDKPDPEPEPPEPPEPPPQASQSEPEPEPPEPQSPPLLLLPAPPPPPDLPNLDDLDDRPDDQPHDDAPAICLPDQSGTGQIFDPFRLASRITVGIEEMLHLLKQQRDGWDGDDYRDFARFRLERTWHSASPEQQQRIESYVYHAKGTVGLVYGTDAVVEINETSLELHIAPWDEIEERLAPAIAQARAEDDLRRRDERARQILATKLPPKRKLKKVRTLLDELLALDPGHINDAARRGIAAVQAMRGDTDGFADCTTFGQYVLLAGEESSKTDTSDNQ